MESVLAIDLGATSGRGVLYWIEDGLLKAEELSRFENIPIKERGNLCWNSHQLMEHIVLAIKLAQEKSDLQSVGIDTWGVDFALLDSQGELIAQPVHYRDSRTNGVLEEIGSYSSLEELYYKTGNQIMEINTLFQLIRLKNRQPDQYYKADRLVMVSDYLNYMLTGQIAIEKTIASTMQLLNPYTREWNKELLASFEIADNLFPSLVKPGNILGRIQEKWGLRASKVINVCQHDTASAIASIPDDEERVLYISSGTWSLIGTVLSSPLISKESYDKEFTNEFGLDDSITFLKNCTGLWIFEELRRQFKEQGQEYSFQMITEMIENCQEDVARIDTENPEFASAGNMIEKITAYAQRTNQVLPSSPAHYFKIAYYGLAEKYKQVISELEDLLGYSFEKLYLLGGGSKSNYFSQLVADVTGKIVVTGLYEATSIGNALVQFKALGCVKDMKEAKELVKESITFNYFYPKEEEENDTIS